MTYRARIQVDFASWDDVNLVPGQEPEMTTATSHKGDLELLRVVVYREGDVYVAQCLEVDIATQAKDLDELLERLDLTIDAECAASRERGGEPFEGIAPAPNYFHGLWKKRSVALTHLQFPVAQHCGSVEVALSTPQRVASSL